jgi:hypothetical protein
VITPQTGGTSTYYEIGATVTVVENYLPGSPPNPVKELYFPSSIRVAVTNTTNSNPVTVQGVVEQEAPRGCGIAGGNALALG